MPGLGPLGAALSVYKHGVHTSDPEDKNYPKSWEYLPLRDGERVTDVLMGSMDGRWTGGLVNVRVADGPDGRVAYVDRPKIPRVGIVGNAVGKVGDQIGAFTPLRLENPTLLADAATHRVRISAGEKTIRARDDVVPGRMADGSPREQWDYVKKMFSLRR